MSDKKSGVHGFGNIGRGDDSDSEDEKYYAGGSSKSGVQIKDPRKGKKNNEQYIDDIFEKAKANGGKTDEEYQPEEPSKFMGSAFKLGDTNMTKPAPEKKNAVYKIVFYKNGFVVNDGPLRKYDDPKNKEFIDDINEGYVPQELEETANGLPVHTEMVNNKGQDYIEPEKPYVAFTTPGSSLGGTSKTVQITGTIPTEFKLDDSAPMTTLQIRFHDGSKMTQKFNLKHTVGDIKCFIDLQKKTSSPYIMLSGFPPKPLSDMSATIEDAGLKAAAITQKLN